MVTSNGQKDGKSAEERRKEEEERRKKLDFSQNGAREKETEEQPFLDCKWEDGEAQGKRMQKERRSEAE